MVTKKVIRLYQVLLSSESNNNIISVLTRNLDFMENTSQFEKDIQILFKSKEKLRVTACGESTHILFEDTSYDKAKKD